MEMNKNTLLPIVIILAIIVVVAGVFLVKSISDDSDYVDTSASTNPAVSQMTLALQQQLNDEKAKTTEAEAKLTTTETENSNYKKQIADLQAQLEALQAPATTTFSGPYSFDLNDPKFDYTRCTEYEKQAKDVYEDAKDDVDDAEDDLDDEEDDLRDLQQKRDAALVAYNAAQSNSTFTQTQVDSLQRTYEKYDDKVGDKEDDVDDAEDDLDDAEDDEDDAKDMYDDTKSKCRGH